MKAKLANVPHAAVNSKHPLNIYHDCFHFKGRLRSSAKFFFSVKQENRNTALDRRLFNLAMNIIRLKN